MKLSLHLHLGEDETHYKIEEEIVYVKYISRKIDSEGVYEEKEYLDKFDFSRFGDGELMFNDPETFEELTETKLPINPIISAKREDGELSLELIYWQDQEFTEVVQDYFKWISPEDLVVTNDFDLEDITEEAKMVWVSDEQNLMDRKEAKKNELSSDCQEDILYGFSYELGGEEYRVSYDRESQTNLQERYTLFENNLIESITMTLHKGKEDFRVEVDKEQFTKIYLASVVAKENKISKLRDNLIPLLDNATTLEEVENIKWEKEFPEEGTSIYIDDSETLGKQISDAKDQTKRTQQSLSMTNSGLLELTLLTMMGDN